MVEHLTRRNVLKATAATGIAASAAGCSSVPIIGGDSGPCSDAETAIEASIEGDYETAADYVPYEYVEGMDRDEIIQMLEMQDEMMGEMDDFDISVSCEDEEQLEDDEIEAMQGNFGDYEITDAYEVELVTSVEGEFNGEEIDEETTETDYMVEIDGDGWYGWDPDGGDMMG